MSTYTVRKSSLLVDTRDTMEQLTAIGTIGGGGGEVTRASYFQTDVPNLYHFVCTRRHE